VKFNLWFLWFMVYGVVGDARFRWGGWKFFLVRSLCYDKFMSFAAGKVSGGMDAEIVAPHPHVIIFLVHFCLATTVLCYIHSFWIFRWQGGKKNLI
jgi:hypothetical protein